MGPVEAKLHCIVDKFRSWIPRRTETSDTSRVFWMPDQSCRVCYECDLPFTIFNRRHHFRVCGRVFCGRCTVNTIPAAFAEGRNYQQEDRERIRVCIFCYKQWEQETIPAKCNGLELLSPAISPSLSYTSLASSESSGNSNSTISSSIRSIMAHSAVPYHHITYSSCLNLVEANELDQERNSDNTDLVSTLESEGPTSSAFGIPTNRILSGAMHFEEGTRTLSGLFFKLSLCIQF
ncbi:hypothetical protein SUGI_0135480 [Cryptomeria japonica]|nr:hypothetical protein SUGI_0135480 [Cryptomeria japonica]